MPIGLVVREGFEGRAPGSIVSDADAVARILRGPERAFVIRTEVADDNAAVVAELKSEIAADESALAKAETQGA